MGRYISPNLVLIQDPTNPTQRMTVNEEGRGDVVQHAHPDSTSIHFHVNGLATGTYRYILIDISNAGVSDANYKHVGTNYAHIEWLQMQVDSDNNGDYTINMGFLENVGGATGDRYWIDHWSGTKTAGNQLGPLFEAYYPNGWHMTNTRITTHAISLADANWSTADTYGDSINPAGAVGCGTGDVVLEIVVAAGNIDFEINLGYHAH